MPQVKFTGSQGMVDTRPVQYNVQPNLSASRAIDNLSKALTGAAQFATKVSEDNFREEARNLELTVAQKREEWAGLSYKERKSYMQNLQEDLVDKYGEDTYYSRQLRNSGEKALAAFGAQLQQQGVEEEYLDNLTSQNKGMMQFGEDWANAQNQAERQQLLQKFQQNFVLPYEGYNDANSRKLFNNGLQSYAKFQQNFTEKRIAIRDQDYLSSVLDGAVTAVAMDGTVDVEMYNQLVDKMSNISNFEENRSQYIKNLGNQIVMSIVNEANKAERTWENALNFEQKLNDFAQVDKRIKASDSFKAAMTAVRGFKNTANTRDISSLSALVQNDRASLEDVISLGDELVSRGALSPEIADNQEFLKTERLRAKNVTLTASNYYVDSDLEGLLDLQAAGKGATVKRVVTDNLNLEFATLVDEFEGDAVKAMENIFAKRKKFTDMGIDVGGIDAIDAVISAPSNGGLVEDSDAVNFVTAMQTAIDNDYQSPAITKGAISDYVVLKAWTKMGMQDIGSKYQSYKTNTGVRVNTEDVMSILDEIVDNDIWSENLADKNFQQFKSALAAPIRAALRAGIPMDDLEEQWEDALYAQYFDADPFWGTNGRILVPKAGRINNKDAYNTIAKHFGDDATVLPVDILNPEGKWMVLPADGSEVQTYDFEFMEFLAKARIAPTPEQLEKYKQGGYDGQ